MAVPKTTDTRCMNGSVQARHTLYLKFFCEFSYEITASINVWLKKDVGMGLLV